MHNIILGEDVECMTELAFDREKAFMLARQLIALEDQLDTKVQEFAKAMPKIELYNQAMNIDPPTCKSYGLLTQLRNQQTQTFPI